MGKYSQEVISEALALYESGEQVSEINRALGLTDTTIYHFLKSRGLKPRAKRVVSENHSENPGNSSNPLMVTVDKEGFVQSVERKKGQLFEISFSGVLLVEATSIEEAIANARKRTFVGRIHSVKES